MAQSNWANRTLFHGDNLDFLRALNSETVHLIATDPPFNKGRDFHATPDSLANGASFQDRWSWKDDIHQEWIDQLEDDWPNVWSVIQGSRDSWCDDMGAFLCWLAVRVLEMHRILKPTGSMYLHLDDTAHAYVKVMMAAVFGHKNFRNEIIWNRSGGKSDSKKWGRVHDVLLYYTKDYRKFTWNQQYQPLDVEYVRGHYRYDDNDGRGLYRRLPLHAAGITKGESGRKWRNYDPTKHNRHWALPSKGVMYQYIVENEIVPGWPTQYTNIHERLEALDVHGLIVHSKTYLPEIKTYLAATRGKATTDFVADIPMASGGEKTGYPTQKPLALYERIIKASSNPGDVVLDPFAGCATTCVAAEKLGRQWAGIDIWDGAHQVTIDRLQKEGFLAGPDDNRPDLLVTEGQITYSTKPPTRTDDAEYAAPHLRTPKRVHEPPGPKMTRARM